jgi:hypothetical protein
MPAPPAAAACSSSALNTPVTVWPVLTGFHQPSHWSISVVDAVPVMGGGASCVTATVHKGPLLPRTRLECQRNAIDVAISACRRALNGAERRQEGRA